MHHQVRAVPGMALATSNQSILLLELGGRLRALPLFLALYVTACSFCCLNRGELSSCLLLEACASEPETTCLRVELRLSCESSLQLQELLSSHVGFLLKLSWMPAKLRTQGAGGQLGKQADPAASSQLRCSDSSLPLESPCSQLEPGGT